jgi:hypothetical protein
VGTRSAPVIELLGPPAVGKSTLADRLAEMDGCVVVKDHDRGDVPVLARSLLAAGPVLAHLPPAGVSRARWVAWAGRLAAAHSVVERRVSRGASMVVFDQGPAYTLGRMTDVCRTRAGSQWWHRRLTECASLLDVVVLLDADRPALLDRLVTREKQHVALGLDAEDADSYLADRQHDCRVMASWLEHRGVPVVRLNTSRITADDEWALIHPLLLRPTEVSE